MLVLCFLFGFSGADAAESLSGRIFIQVESRGEAWYLDPVTGKRLSLGKPDESFLAAARLAKGITDANIEKIPTGLVVKGGADSDGDGIEDSYESALGTDIHKKDSDGDSFSDKDEVISGHNPNGPGKIISDQSLIKSARGKFFLQVQSHGRLWYVNPADSRKYHISGPSDMFYLIRAVGTGISNKDLSRYQVGSTSAIAANPPTPSYPTPSASPSSIKSKVAKAVATGDKKTVMDNFLPERKKMASFTIDFLNEEGRRALAQLINQSELIENKADKQVYGTSIEFNGRRVDIKYEVVKTDGGWKMNNL